MFGLGLDPTQVYDKPAFTPGTVLFDGSGRGYQFAKASTGWTAGDVVVITPSVGGAGVTTALGAPGTGQGKAAGVAAATVPTDSYGWVQRVGAVSVVNAATSSPAYTTLNTTTTAGRVSATATAGTRAIPGVALSAAAASNVAAGVLNWPYVGVTN